VSWRPGKTTLVYFGSQVATTLAGFLATWYINVRLGSVAFGEYSTAVAFLFWLNIPASALGNAVKKRVSEGDERGSFLATGHLLNLAVHAALVGGLLVFREQVDVFVGVEVASVFAALVAARAVFDLTLGSLHGFKQVGTSGAIKTVERVLRSGIHVGAIFFLGVGVAGLVLGHAVALLIATGAGLVALEGRPSRPTVASARSLGEYARFAWLGTLKTRAFAWTDVMVMRGLSLSVIGLAAVSKSQIGIYKVSWTMASVLALVSIAIKQTLFPELSELAVDDDYDRVHHFVEEGLAFTGVFAIPGLFGGVVVGDVILTIFGAEYAAGGTILVILIGARLVAAYGEQLINAINAIDRPDVSFRINLAYVAANVGLNLLLVSLLGWYGAAAATALSALVSLVVAGVALSRLIGRPSVPLVELGYQAGASVVMLVVVVAARRLVPGTLGWTLAVVALGAAVYVLALLALSVRVRSKALSLVPFDVT